MVKKHIIIDLDETIINSIATEDFDNKDKTKLELFDYKNMDDYYYVCARPHLQTFLDFIFANFNVSVWTAASKSYALFIIEHFILVKPKRKLEYVFFSYHCDLSKKLGRGIKDLSLLWDKYKLEGFNKTNVKIIDDNMDVVKTGNCFQIKEFNFKDDDCEGDIELVKMKAQLKEFINAE